MAFVQQLWLAIVLSAAAAWFWSFLSWAALDLHGKDFDQPPDDEKMREAVRSLNLSPGHYFFPFASGKQKSAPEYQRRWKEGPLGVLHVWSPRISMPRNMILSYLTNLAASFLMAYVGYETLPAGSGFTRVWQVMGTIGVLTYSIAFIPNMIWFQGRGRVMALCVIDGVVTGLAVGAVFAAMWPSASGG